MITVPQKLPLRLVFVCTPLSPRAIVVCNSAEFLESRVTIAVAHWLPPASRNSLVSAF